MISIKNKKGFTLMEILTAIGVFAFTMVIVVGVFKSVIEGQRGAIAAQNTQESMRFAMEVMSKEIRTAKNFSGCGAGGNLIYNTSGGDTELRFKNKDNFCVTYSLDNSRLKIVRDNPLTGPVEFDGYITPDEINVSNLNFTVVDNASAPKNLQAKVTMKMDVEASGKAIHKNKMTIQTTVSSRSYAD